jgi:hypothetical protein
MLLRYRVVKKARLAVAIRGLVRDIAVLSFFGMILFIVAGVDAAGLLFGWSLTGYGWSPLIIGVLGFALVTLEALEREHSPERSAAWPQPTSSHQRAALAPPRDPLLRSTES